MVWNGLSAFSPLLATVEGGERPGRQVGDFWKILPREESGSVLRFWLHGPCKTWLRPHISASPLFQLRRPHSASPCLRAFALAVPFAYDSLPPSVHTAPSIQVCAQTSPPQEDPPQTAGSRGASRSPPQLPYLLSRLRDFCRTSFLNLHLTFVIWFVFGASLGFSTLRQQRLCGDWPTVGTWC